MLRLYNTMSRRKEDVKPIEQGRVKIYSCGPTVYRYIHIGNLRTFVMADWLRRTLTLCGLDVLHIKNITDVGHMRVELLDRGEDKLIAQARKEGRSSAEIAAFYTQAFLEDERALNILPAHVFPRATEHIPEMIEIIAGLLERGLAYSAGGTIYFDVNRFPDYGKLSGNQLAALIEGVRDTSDPHKRHPEDFALWKTAEPGRELAWESPWGRGFPGWHIECSAMSMKYLGRRFDIHTGGVDNIFPHHEDEIAQSEGFTGRPFVNIWAHAQHLLADGLKMAKSTGNAYTRADIVARGFEPLALRYLYSQTHYRSRLNFTFSALRAAQSGLSRMRLAAMRLAGVDDGRWTMDDRGLGPDERRKTNEDREKAERWKTNGESQPVQSVAHSEKGSQILASFQSALEDDLNMPRAMAVVWGLIRRSPDVTASEKLALLREFDNILGFELEPSSIVHRPSSIPQEITALIHERAAFRGARRYPEADALREQVATAGFHLRDTPTGTVAVRLAADQEFPQITRSADVPDATGEPDHYAFSINLLGRDNCADLRRSIESIARNVSGHSLELVVIDNGSTDETVAYLQDLARTGLRDERERSIPLTILFADHNLGFAAGRNATMRPSRGQIVVLLDTSIELRAPIWEILGTALADQEVGLAGPYGLRTANLKEFDECEQGDADAIEGYLMAFRRELLPEMGWLDERFRFYRLLDIHTSFFIKTAGYRVVALSELAERLIKHPHREWYSLSEEERAAKSKKNFDIYYRRWHHGQSLMAVNYEPSARWFGHDVPAHTHPPDELPLPGVAHSHPHQHWPDHAHEHPHVHEELPMPPTTRDDALYERAKFVLPGGVSATARLNAALGRPFYVQRGEGAYVEDLDGRRYVDLCTSHGASLLGHGHPAILGAVERALGAGVICAYETEHQVALAEQLAEHIPCAEQARFAGSGSEAMMHALRLARAASGRELIVKFEGHFHGYADVLNYSWAPPLEQAGSQAHPATYPESAGMPAALTETVLVVPFNDPAALEAAFAANGSQIAALLLEPVNYDSGCIPPAPGFLELCRRLCDQAGAVLLFDEVLTAFRMHPAGAQGWSGVTPDLAVLGKAFGAGMPISAVVGKRSIMQHLRPEGASEFSGTFLAHLTAVLAAHAATQVYWTPGFYERLDAIGEQFYGGFERLIQRSGVPVRLQHVGARFGLYFGITEPVTGYRAAARQRKDLMSTFVAGCIRRGAYVHLAAHHGFSAVHDDAAIDTALNAIDGALEDVRRVL